VLFVRNLATHVETAVASVLQQGSSDDVELLVFDGGSTDGTAELLKRHEDRYAHFASKPDRGPAFVINEGVRRARGDAIVLLAGDDRLEPGALARIAARFREDPALELLCCGVRMLSAAGAERLYASADALGFELARVVRTPLTHGRIFRRDVYLRVGLYDTTIPYTHDLDFLIRCHLAGVRWKVDPALAYTYVGHAGSRTLSGLHTDIARNSLDNLAIARRHLADARLGRDDRSALLDLHARAAARCVLSSICERSLRRAWPYARDAFRTDARWPHRAFAQLAAR
jgi:glycosyltransferase involved in cell wall biosynthesis